METPKDPQNNNMTLGDHIFMISFIVIIFAYFYIFKLVTGQFPRGGSRGRTDPNVWELYFGGIFAGLGGWLARVIYKKITGRDS